MCGIFLYKGKLYNLSNLREYFDRIAHRGPEDTKYVNIGKEKEIVLGFHRLIINGLDGESMQPFIKKYLGSSNSENTLFPSHGHEYYCIVNGEIYNYKYLIKKYHLEVTTHSDCEVVLAMYLKFGIDRTMRELDGVYGLVIVDATNCEFIAARDPIGIRAMYAYLGKEEKFVVSEMKAIPSDMCGEDLIPFPPGSYMLSSNVKKFYKFFNLSDKMSNDVNPCWIENFSESAEIGTQQEEEKCLEIFSTLGLDTICEENRLKIIKNVRRLFINSVEKRLMSDRPIGCILSGGLDSTLITAVVKKLYNKNVHSYTIGLEGSVDLHYAKIASEEIGTIHHELVISPETYVDSIEKTIYQIESFDVTTVRASIVNFLVCQHVQEINKDKVLFCGDVSDELFAGYRGFGISECGNALHDANMDMLSNIHYFDVLRSDKTIARAALDSRAPFADRNLLLYVMSIPGEYKRFDEGSREFKRVIHENDGMRLSDKSYPQVEKNLLREAFSDFLSDQLIWRRKEAFSDGISSQKYSAFQYIKEMVEKKYTDAQFEEKSSVYTHCKPYDKESLYYREIFEKFFPNRSHTIPYFWKHPFAKIQDPSARFLHNY